MAGEEVVLNFSELVSALPPQIIESIDELIIVLKAAGIAMIAYVVYVIAMGIVSIRRSKKIKFIEEKVISIDKKLNRLLKVKKPRK